MAIDLAALGDKLRKYRTQLEETISEVAEVTGIPSDRLTDVEAGLVEPTGDEILILADHFHCDFRYFISNEKLAPFEQTKALYRVHIGEFSKADRRAIQEFLYLCETEAFLMKELGREHIEFDYTPTDSFMKGHGEPAAKALLKALRFRDNEVPRDVFYEFRRVGVHVFRRHLGNSGISGLFIRHPVAGKCALVNYSEDIYRQRFSAAHEMAHAIFDHDQEASVSYNNGRDLREVRANGFASCFLMPRDFLRKIPAKDGWSNPEALDWAHKLRVSCAALSIALRQAGIVDAGRSTEIGQLRIPRDAKVDPELPADLSPARRQKKARLLELGLSDFYVGLCFDAFKQGVISQGRLAESLLTDASGLVELAELYGRKLHGH